MLKRVFALFLSISFSVVPIFAVSAYASEIWDGNRAESFESGSGFESDPYIIANASQLMLLSGSVSSGNPHTGEYFKLSSDIVLNETDELTWYQTAKKWIPIGNPNTPFNGHFDGNGKTVFGICIDCESDAQGLFGVVGEYGRIISVTTDKSYIVGNSSVGAIAGVNNGIVTNCRNNDSVRSLSNGGGIVGTNNGKIAGCANFGWVGNKGNNGGIAGRNDGTITDCYNNGTVDGGYLVAGGVVGENQGNIDNCYNAGYIISETGKSGSITGFNGGIVNNCYFLDRGSDLDTVGTLLSSDKMMDKESFKGFDFDKVWTMDGDSEYLYPELKGSTDFFTDIPTPPEVEFPNTEFTDKSSPVSESSSDIEPEAKPFPVRIIACVTLTLLAVIIVVAVVKKRR